MSGSTEPTSITKMREKLSDPSVLQSLKGLSKSIQFSFTDIKETYGLVIKDGKVVSLEKKSLSKADIEVTAANTLMESLIDRTANPITAYMSGKLKIKGSMDDLMQLQKLLS